MFRHYGLVSSSGAIVARKRSLFMEEIPTYQEADLGFFHLWKIFKKHKTGGGWPKASPLFPVVEYLWFWVKLAIAVQLNFRHFQRVLQPHKGRLYKLRKIWPSISIKFWQDICLLYELVLRRTWVVQSANYRLSWPKILPTLWNI